ncbi:MAG: hypothetical protein CMH52_03005 [Myxococcales bacterium]|nr:hypothetical protein [Myxococcales bacterium]
MAEEIKNVTEIPADSAPVETAPVETPEPINADQKIQVGGEEYSVQELAETHKNYQQLEEYARGLEGFREATSRLMNPETDASVKKRDARQILLDMNYTPEQVDEWVKVYDESPEMTEEAPTPQVAAPQTDPRTDQLNDQMMKMRAQMLQQNLENSLSGAIDSDSDSKMLIDWLNANRSPEEASQARENVTERVRAQALENLRQRRNHAGSFDDSWVTEEVTKAANKVAKDMLTVIGDTSKIGRVPETAGQTDNLYRKDPVKLPDTTGKSFGDVEGQLRDWTSDQLLRSLSDPGGDSKA